MKLALLGREFEIEVVGSTDGSRTVRIDGVPVDAALARLSDGSALIRLGERSFRAYAGRLNEATLVAVGPAHFRITAIEGVRLRQARGLASAEVAAPMPGKVLRILVAEGDEVGEGQPLLILEAMKTETTLRAESAARVKRISVSAGQTVDHGDLLIELSPTSGPSAPEAEAPES